MHLKLVSCVAAAAALLVSPRALAEEGWLVDFEKAKAEAKAGGKDILMDFTGSDWCGWCIKLREEVFSKPEFKTGVPAHFVLLELDYPQSAAIKEKMGKAIVEQNEKLQGAFKIEGFPTILLADAAGRPYAKTGYQAGGPVAYVKNLDKLREVRAKRDSGFAKAAAATGVDKAKALASGLDGMDEDLVAVHYAAEIKAIGELDPSDSTGVVKRFGFRARLAELGTKIQGKQSDGYKAMRAVADEEIRDGKLSKDQQQKVLLLILNNLRPPKDNADALSLLEDVKAIDAESEAGVQAAGIIPRIKEMIEKAK